MQETSQYIQSLIRCSIFAVCILLFNSGVSALDPGLERTALSLRNLESRNIERPERHDLSCDWDLFQFKLKKIRHLLQFYKPSPKMLEVAGEELNQAEVLLKSLEAKTPSPAKPGLCEEAYFDDIDGSPQPFVRYLPEKYDKNTKFPLIIYLHGYSPYLDIVNWGTMPEGLQELADKLNACVVLPFARGNTDFQGIGEKDVLNVIREMEKRYSIDEDRIILSGMSMGGMGVWTIGSHYPHLFAGLLIISGRGDFYFWHKIKPDSMPASKQLLIDREFAASHLPNLRQLPVRVFHGTSDTLIPVEEARHMKDLLGRPENPLFKYQEIEGGDHWIHEKVYSDNDLIGWLRDVRRLNPESFEYVAYHPAYNQAFWLFIGSFTDNCQPAKVQVEVKDGKVQIRTSGVKELVLDRNRMPERIWKLPVVKLNDFILKEVPGFKNDGPAYSWGPVKDAFLEPFMFVNAGMKDSEFSQRAFEWYKFSKSLPRMKNEKDLTEKDKETFNLFLYGEPESSPMIEEVLKSAPVKITGEEFIVGDKKYPREGNGIYLKYKSPWAPGKSVVVQCGTPWGKSCSENHRYDFLPGYAVYGGESDPEDPFGTTRVLTGGFFDKDGKLIP